MAEARGPGGEAADLPDIRPDHAEAGATLVELLVALALLSLIALFIGEGIASVRAMAPVARRIEAAGDVSLVRDHLRQVLGEALAGLPGGGGAPFRGRPQTIDFLAPGDPLLEVGGVAQVAIALVSGESGFDLVEIRRVQRGTGGEPGARTVLLSSIESAVFAYAPPIRGKAPDWRPTWSETGAPPALVRLDLTLKGVSRALSPLVVHPGNGGGTGNVAPARPKPGEPPDGH